MHVALRFLASVSLLALLSLPASAVVEERAPTPYTEASTYEKAVDLLVVRPLSLTIMVAGAAILPLSWPGVVWFDTPADPVELCIKWPFRYVFKRPLGEL